MTRIEVQMKLAEYPKWRQKLMYELRLHVENFNTQWHMARNCTNKQTKIYKAGSCIVPSEGYKYEGWNFNSGNYLFTTDTK